MKCIKTLLLVLLLSMSYIQKAEALVPTNVKADSLLNQIPVSYPCSFIVMGDSQPYGGQLLNDIFIETLSQVTELAIPLTFVIICGDLTESGNEESYIAYSNFISDWMETTGIPFYSLPGNHDFYDTHSFENYARFIDSRLDYYFDYGNSRFITVNNVQHPDNSYYHIRGTQLDSIDTWLSSGPENKFAFNHVSIVRDNHSGGFVNEGYEAFHNKLVEYNAVADFNGHHRDYYRNDVDETFYLTTAGAGGALGGTYYPPISYNNHHWLYVTVDEQNNVFVEMYFLDAGHNDIASLYDFQIQPRQTSPSIFINEFMASNNGIVTDPQGDYDDWIEIYNADILPVNIGGMYITDDLTDPAKWKIPDTQPDSTTIQPGEFLILWADEDIDDGILHLNIKLAAEGEEIGLYTDDLTSIIDSIHFSEQIANESFGRDPDGFDNWVLMDNPTPGYSNNYIPIAADLYADPLMGFAPLQVTFTDISIGSAISWEWDFDNDGLIDSNDQNPIYEYTDERVYTVSLTVSDGITSDTETKTDYIEVFIPLIADFIADPLSGLIPMEVTFTSSSTGNITSWEWDFDNDGVTDSFEENPTYIYEYPGNFSVALEVSDGINIDTELKIDYISTAEQIIADFTADPLDGMIPLTVNFTNTSSGSIANFEWDFDNDGITDSFEENPMHIYEYPGNYSVSLKVSDGINIDTEVKIDYILATEQIIADFTADPLVGTIPLTVNFTNTSSGPTATYEWDFDNDGDLDSVDENPTYIYSENGLYSVKLTVSDGVNTTSEVKLDYIDATGTSIDINLQSNITELYQNHPNPFNPTTSIKFSIKEGDTGVLTIFNVKGQIMASQAYNSGRHYYPWNANSYSSGIYFYELKTSSFTETKKMLLLK